MWVGLTEFCCIGFIIMICESNPKSPQKQSTNMANTAPQVDHCHESTILTNVVLGPSFNNQHWHNLSKKLKSKEFEMTVVWRFLYSKLEVMSVQSLWCSEISRHSIYNLYCFSFILDLAFFTCTCTVNSRVANPICMLSVVFHVPFSVTRC
jgi:hypothetical protein